MPRAIQSAAEQRLIGCATVVPRPELLTEQVKQEMPSVPVCDSGTSSTGGAGGTRAHTGRLAVAKIIGMKKKKIIQIAN